MRILKQILLAAVAYSLICSRGTADTNNVQPRAVSPKDSSTFVHAFTKFSFPKSVGKFQRVKIQKYDHDGKDVGVGYDSSLPIAATIFAYPGAKDFALLPSPKLENVSELLLTHHFESCKQDVFRAHTDAKLINESPYTLIQGDHRFDGKKAVFSMRYNFGFASQDSVSELYVFLIEPSVKFLLTERYFMTYRITYPTNKKAEAEAEIATFMADLAWPTK